MKQLICFTALFVFVLSGCNRDKSETVDTTILSAPSAPTPEETPQQAPAAKSQTPTIPTAAAPSPSSPITYQLPPGWTQQPGADMRFATLNGPEHMQIAITVFPGDVGGPLANVNRWRRQMDLPPIAQDQLGKSITSVDTKAGAASVVDLSNNNQRMLAAMLPLQSQTWFFKMTGPTNAVGKYADDYMAILKSVSMNAP